MIKYDSNRLRQICAIAGSNIPRAMLFTMPSVFLGIGLCFMISMFPDYFGVLEEVNFTPLLSVTAIVLSLLLALRTTKAYERFWEGITLVQLMRAEWFQSASTLIAFSHVAIKRHPEDSAIEADVHNFQFTLIRLMSLIHGTALRQIGGHEEEFEVVDINALDEASLGYLASSEDNRINPVEVVLHWIQILITDTSTSTQALSIPTPILTRVFQTLSRGMVNCHNARKLADCPFPFPLYQMVLVLLIIHCIVTPLFVAANVSNAALVALCTFLPIFGMWSITFTAGELEQPFGSDPNDLPLTSIQKDFNISLMMLLDKATFRAPFLSDTSPRTVKKLRRVHTQNSRDDASRTDTLHIYEKQYQPSEDDTELTTDALSSRRSNVKEDEVVDTTKGYCACEHIEIRNTVNSLSELRAQHFSAQGYCEDSASASSKIFKMVNVSLEPRYPSHDSKGSSKSSVKDELGRHQCCYSTGGGDGKEPGSSFRAPRENHNTSASVKKSVERIARPRRSRSPVMPPIDFANAKVKHAMRTPPSSPRGC